MNDIKTSDTSAAVLELKHIQRRYQQGSGVIEVLKGTSFVLRPGETVALIAPSGAGKSTFLHIAGLLEQPDAGQVIVNGQPATALSDSARTRIRRVDIGFVYQFHHLLPEFSALENVMMPQLISGLARHLAKERAAQLLKWLGLEARVAHRPSELSGGEQQRVAIARAMANGPRVLLADEPTGNLDPQAAHHVFDMLLTLTRGAQVGALVATHNLELAARMDRRVTLKDGQVVEVE